MKWVVINVNGDNYSPDTGWFTPDPLGAKVYNSRAEALRCSQGYSFLRVITFSEAKFRYRLKLFRNRLLTMFSKRPMFWLYLQLWNALGGTAAWGYSYYSNGGFIRPCLAITVLIWAIVIYRNLREARAQRNLKWVGKIMDS